MVASASLSLACSHCSLSASAVWVIVACSHIDVDKGWLWGLKPPHNIENFIKYMHSTTVMTNSLVWGGNQFSSLFQDAHVYQEDYVIAIATTYVFLPNVHISCYFS